MPRSPTSVVRTSATVLAAFGVFAGGATTPSLAAATACPAPRGAVVLRSSGLAVVHAIPVLDRRGRRVTYVGCLRATGRRAVLFRSQPDASADQSYANTFTLGGPFVAFVTTTWNRYDDIAGTLRVADLRTGHTHRVAIVTSVRLRFPQPAAERMVTRVVLASSGAIVWTANRRGGLREVWVADRVGVHRLDRGRGTITHLYLLGETVTWTRDGREHRSTLRIP